MERFLPSDNDDKVHDVPHVSEVATGMQNEPLSKNLQTRLHREDPEKVGLRGFLQTREGTCSFRKEQLSLK